jgi:hypothetical protein
MAVDNGRGLAVTDNFEFCDRLLDFAFDNSVVVDRLHATNAVGEDAALVGINQHLGANPGIFIGNSGSFEDIHHESFQKVKRYPGSA